MTDPIAPPHPVEYSTPTTPEAAPRPTSVGVIAGIGIVLGALFLLCKPANLFVNLFMPMPAPNPLIDAMRNEPTLRFFILFSTVTGTLISLLLFISSLGSLALRPWARAGMLGYAVLALLMTAVEQGAAVYVVGPEMERAMRQSGIQQPRGVAWMSGWIGMTLVLLFKLWYPALIFYYYNRRPAKAAFERGLPGAGI